MISYLDFGRDRRILTVYVIFTKSYFWQALAVVLAGWINKQQQLIIEYLQEENRVLREQIGDKRIHFTNAQRLSLAT